jgi:hypothetical protein
LDTDLAAWAFDGLATTLEALGALAGALAAVLEPLADLTAGLAVVSAGLATDFAPGLAPAPGLTESALEDLPAVLKVALATAVGVAFFVAAGLTDTPRPEACFVALALGVVSAFVLATALAGGLEAFAFTTAPFLVSAASTVVGTIGLSCHDEGN